MRLFFDRFDSPVGPLAVGVDGSGALVGVAFLGTQPAEAALARGAEGELELAPERCATARRQLEEYFVRERRAFDLQFELRGTPFQKSVWAELLRIPYGTTLGYGELARRLGLPGSARAVGRANHENPLPIVVPCHRVIGADGRLVGFGGGKEVQAWLVDHERGQGRLGGGAGSAP